MSTREGASTNRRRAVVVKCDSTHLNSRSENCPGTDRRFLEPYSGRVRLMADGKN
jgi:hypothetical protein